MSETIELPENETYHETLADVISYAFSPLYEFLEILQENDRFRSAGSIGTNLHDKALDDLEKVLELMHKHVGHVQFTIAVAGNSRNLPAGKAIGCSLSQA